MEATFEQLNHYFSQLSSEEQQGVLHLVEVIAKSRNEDSDRISVEQYNTEIEAALAEAERGETVAHEEVVALSKQW